MKFLSSFNYKGRSICSQDDLDKIELSEGEVLIAEKKGFISTEKKEPKKKAVAKQNKKLDVKKDKKG